MKRIATLIIVTALGLAPLASQAAEASAPTTKPAAVKPVAKQAVKKTVNKAPARKQHQTRKAGIVKAGGKPVVASSAPVVQKAQ